MAIDAPIAALRTLAEERHRDPAAVRRRAEEVLADPTLAPAAAPVAEWVLGLALHEMGDTPGAVDHLRRAARAAARTGDTETEAVARAGLAVSLLSRGDTAGARREIARADEVAPVAARGRVDIAWALIHQRMGELDPALARFRVALPRLRRDGDRHSVARALLNRGTLLAYQGATDAALADFAEVETLADELGLPVLGAMAAHNAGFALGRRGAAGEALDAFARAEAAYDELGRPPRLVAVLAADRCDVLLQVGLADDARDAAAAAVHALDGVDAAHAAEARLLLAQAALAADDLDRAAAEATAAEAAFGAGRPPWAALAGYVAMQAEIRRAQDEAVTDPALLTRSVAAARRLEQQGWPIEALHARTFVGRVALALGRPGAAADELATAAAARRRGPVGMRAQAWHATALVRLAAGDRSGAKQALRRGLHVVDDHRARLGATELRVGAAAHGQDLARLGVRLALADGRPWEVLRWAERWRAGSLRLPRVAAPPDPGLAAALADLRAAESDLREATLAGDPAPALLGRIARLERGVRDRARRASGGEAQGPARPLTGPALADALGDRTLVEYVAVEGRLHAVAVTAGRATVHALGDVATVHDEVQHLLFALRRLLAAGGASSGSGASGGSGGSIRSGAAGAGVDSVVVAARRVDDLLVRPLAVAGDGGVVVVPTDPLHQLAWSVLPSLADRPVTVAPSAALWLDRARAAHPHRPARTLAVAGPGLAGATPEAEAVAGVWPGSRMLRDEHATVAAVLDALPGVDLAHVAAHGRFRSDSPMFSALGLADGPLTIYDLERVESLPATIVLPACSAALPRVTRGDEVLGTATALVGLGVGSVVAPVLPVPDAATGAFSLAVHRWLAADVSPAVALARACSDAAHGGDGRAWAVAAAFVCIGADEGTGEPAPARPRPATTGRARAAGS
ncbi:MAG TPA: CHAT domain-containing protein [Acidimicrobiales bacterium]|nr:CHAT domain-containing protein [Acidimicrobiales bacterium]